MRRNYISPEFDFQPVYGSLNMLEQSSFFCSKMLDIEDSLKISNENIVWYQQPNGEQFDINVESSNAPNLYNTVDDKKMNHTLILDQSQSVRDRELRAAWILDIELKIILKNYLFATLKKWRTFEKVANNFTLSRKVDTAITEYIDKNVLNRYKFEKVEFYLEPIRLINFGGLQFVNTFDSSIENPNNLFTKIQTETDPNGIDVKIRFNQTQPASSFNYKYYFNLYFSKL